MGHSNLDSTFSDKILAAPLRLSEEFPEEVQFFCRRFIWPSNRAGFYTREKYFGTAERSPWRPFKRANGQWQHLYTDLVIELAEKHLDYERFCRSCPPKSQVRPKESETAFWLGTMAGERAWNDCLDLDSHGIIGYYAVPSRWHPSKHLGDPWYDKFARTTEYDWRLLPVVRMPLEHFRLLKAVYDVFINRIWAFSSANLGFGLWRIYPNSKITHDRHDELRRQLAKAKLEHIEAYPMPPKSKKSLGRCHRRPCGMDSGIITEQGLVTDPIVQVRLFMKPPPTPSFETICATICSKLDQMYDAWLAWDATEPTTVMAKEKRIEKQRRPEVVGSLRADLEIIKDWLQSGCPKERTVVATAAPAVEMEETAPADNSEVATADELVRTDNNNDLLPCGEQVDDLIAGTPNQRPYLDYFYSVDLKAVNKNEKWVQFCIFLATHGFPCHDRFLEVVSTLAKWFSFYELYHLLPDRTRIKELLVSFCFSKNNGFITRLEQGQINEVIANVDRIVDDVIDNENDDGKLVFAEMRVKRDSGQYPEVYRLEPLMGNGEAGPSNTHSLSGPILCGALGAPRDEGDERRGQGGVYEPDDSPLPRSLSESILHAFMEIRSPLRKNKAGEYPTLKQIGRLVNHLYSRRNKGRGRVSRQLFERMGFPKNSSKKERIKRVLQKAGIIEMGGYRSKRQSREYWLTARTLDILDEERHG